jgi:hypothetical protein
MICMNKREIMMMVVGNYSIVVRAKKLLLRDTSTKKGSVNDIVSS